MQEKTIKKYVEPVLHGFPILAGLILSLFFYGKSYTIHKWDMSYRIQPGAHRPVIPCSAVVKIRKNAFEDSMHPN
jgi:hypothetical protein